MYCLAIVANVCHGYFWLQSQCTCIFKCTVCRYIVVYRFMRRYCKRRVLLGDVYELKVLIQGTLCRLAGLLTLLRTTNACVTPLQLEVHVRYHFELQCVYKKLKLQSLVTKHVRLFYHTVTPAACDSRLLTSRYIAFISSQSLRVSCHLPPP